MKWTDEEILTVLDLHDSGVAYKDIADRYSATKGAIAGLMKRVRDETNQHFPPCNADGTLKKGWWKKRSART